MLQIDDAWQGAVQFWELIFGTWLVYGFLVLLWEKALREPLEEWRYVLLVFLGASFFWINHYLQRAPFYFWVLNGYTAVVWVAWYWIAVRGRGSLLWTILASLSFVLFTLAYIGFEQIARYLVKNLGFHEFHTMLISYVGFAALIWWRARASRREAGA
ncbi:MAG: hypothetical protein FJ197_02245 [Gammaproteobacteria bacterium]|nr:hypothetical protein [Gammaproteobacteria bacterium]